MKLDPKDAPKVRMLTTNEGKFLNFDDMRVSLQDDRVIDTALAMLKVGTDHKQDPRQMMRVAIGGFIFASAGEKVVQDRVRDDKTGSAKSQIRPTGDVTDAWLPIVIKTDDTVFTIRPRNGNDFTADELQAIVGGHFELIPLSRSRYMALNEDGKGQHLPLNHKATHLLRTESQALPDDFIVGDVLICFQKQIK